MAQETAKDTLLAPGSAIKVTVSLGIKVPAWTKGGDPAAYKAAIEALNKSAEKVELKVEVKEDSETSTDVEEGKITRVALKGSDGKEATVTDKTGAAFKDTIIIYIAKAEEPTTEEPTTEEPTTEEPTTEEPTTEEPTTEEPTTPEQTTPEQTTPEETTGAANDETTAGDASASNEGEVDPGNQSAEG